MNNEKQARKLLGSWLRQDDGAGKFPAQVPMVPALAALVDEPTAQKIWAELLTERAAALAEIADERAARKEKS